MYIRNIYIMGYLKMHDIDTVYTTTAIGDEQQMSTQVYSYAFHD